MKKGLPNDFLGYVYILLIASLLLGSALSRLVTKNHSSIMLASLAVITTSFLIVALFNTLYIIVLSMIFFELSWGVLTPSLTYWRNLLIPSEIRATLLSIVLGISTIGSSIIVASLSKLSSIVSLNFVYTLVIPFLGLLSIILFTVMLVSRENLS
ncbi:hypothetical protein [Candidatus Acidianus copahuensis]|uniref:hypothetical protein n=1 Tax=Candidatus Acidianus copahuensis TaxID=1160895 RepID=UPI0012370E50|nr:hypothetical protein [Candidatus Acidianus copahuensis]